MASALSCRRVLASQDKDPMPKSKPQEPSWVNSAYELALQLVQVCINPWRQNKVRKGIDVQLVLPPPNLSHHRLTPLTTFCADIPALNMPDLSLHRPGRLHQWPRACPLAVTLAAAVKEFTPPECSFWLWKIPLEFPNIMFPMRRGMFLPQCPQEVESQRMSHLWNCVI